MIQCKQFLIMLFFFIPPSVFHQLTARASAYVLYPILHHGGATSLYIFIYISWTSTMCILMYKCLPPPYYYYYCYYYLSLTHLNCSYCLCTVCVSIRRRIEKANFDCSTTTITTRAIILITELIYCCYLTITTVCQITSIWYIRRKK